MPRLSLNGNCSQHEIHDDGIITGRLALAKELLKMISEPDKRKKYTPTKLNTEIEKHTSLDLQSPYHFLIEMEVGDSVRIESKKRLWLILSTLTNWKNKNKNLSLYEMMKDRKFFLSNYERQLV